MFNVQRRMADWNFARAQTWEELVLSHDQWVTEYNTQDHWAHQKREDGRTSPAAVLDWVRGHPVSGADLERAFAPVQLPRRVDRSGYVRFRQWRVYAERGLARKTVAVWLTTERLVVAYSDEPLAQYAVTYARDRRHLRTVTEERLFHTPFGSPQPLLWEPQEGEWLRVLQLSAPLARRRRRVAGGQLALFAVGE